MRGYLRLDLADNCNIRCVMCQAYNDLPIARMKFVDFDNFVARTRGRLNEWTVIQLGNVAEPTVHPRFSEFLRYVRSESNATIHIVTNGKLLHRHAETINDVGGCLVQVSMDSVHKHTHEYIRNGSNYDRLVANLGMLDTARTRVLLSFTLMNSNIGEYDDMIEFCRERGFQMSAFPMILRVEHGVLPLKLVRESLWFNRQALQSWMERHYGKSYGSIVFGAAPGTSDAGIDAFTCDAHVMDVSIDAAGTTVLCGKVKLGSLEGEGLEDLWKGETADEFRREVDEDRAPCMTCDYRLRCLAPSMSLLENHFTPEINLALSAETKRTIAYDRNISDDEALSRFIADLKNDYGVFDVERQDEQNFRARRVLGIGRYGPTLEATTRHELQTAMAAEVVSKYDIVLVERDFLRHNIVRYLGKYWGLPIALGRLNVSRDADRAQPGVLSRDTIEELRLAIENVATTVEIVPRYEVVLVEQAFLRHNIVRYLGKYWGLPIALGNLDICQEADRGLPGVLACDTIEEVRHAIENGAVP